MLHHQKLRWILLAITAMLLAACSPATTPASKSAPTHVSTTPTVAPAATIVPTSTPTSTPPTSTGAPTAMPVPSDQDLAQLKSLLKDQLPTDQSTAPDQPIEISVLPLTTTGMLGPWYAAYTTGSIFDPDAKLRHLLTLYTFAEGRWNELHKIELDTANYVDPASVQQVLIEPSHIWLEVQSGAGAHSGCYDLFAFDPGSRSVTQQLSSCSSSPGAGYTTDVNDDGQLDVVLDATDYYVFCYACGVTKPQHSVLAWDGARLSEVALSTLFDTTPVEAQQFNNEAVQLAHAGLWQEAQAAIKQAAVLNGANPVVRWNAALMALQVEALQEQIQAQTFPLFNHLFYGDYAAVLDVLRAYTPADLFRVDTPLFVGTPAENNIDLIANYISDSANAALQVKPDLAAAYFLRGWITYLQNPGSPLALDDIARAAELDPNEKLFSDSVQFLK